MSICSVPECGRGYYAKNYCRLHWERARRHGSPIIVQVPRDMPAAERLAHRSERQGDCVVFTGCTNASGYGQITIANKQVAVHRVAYELAHGPIPEGLVIRHKCDNPPCIDPSHLELGTPQDNVMDKVARGRTLKGSRNGSSKLVEAQVAEILEGLAMGVTHKVLAQRHGVATSTIGRISTREHWKHVGVKA